MNTESCLLYAGLIFRLEWYFDEMGYSQPYEYFKELSDVQKRKFLLDELNDGINFWYIYYK